MNKKLNYEAPEMEVVKVRMETGILSFSGDGQGTATGQGMYREEEEAF